jgi:signal transduction histidine kinase
MTEMEPTPTNSEEDRALETLHRLQDKIANAQHDLRNPLGNVLGFCEILLNQVKSSPNQELRAGLESICQAAEQMVKEVDQVLDPNKIPAGPEAVKALQVQLRQEASYIIAAIQSLIPAAGASSKDVLREDLSRMSDSAMRLGRVIETSLSLY